MQNDIDGEKVAALQPAIEELKNLLREFESDDPLNSHASNLTFIIRSLIGRAESDQENIEAYGILEYVKSFL